MLVDTFDNRLQKALNMRHMKPIQLSEKTGLDKSLISNYLSGNYKAKQDNLTLLSTALNVSETWLMGYDVPITDGMVKEEPFDELELLFSKNKDILTDDDKETIKFVIEKAKRKVDEQLGE